MYCHDKNVKIRNSIMIIIINIINLIWIIIMINYILL